MIFRPNIRHLSEIQTEFCFSTEIEPPHLSGGRSIRLPRTTTHCPAPAGRGRPRRAALDAPTPPPAPGDFAHPTELITPVPAQHGAQHGVQHAPPQNGQWGQPAGQPAWWGRPARLCLPPPRAAPPEAAPRRAEQVARPEQQSSPADSGPAWPGAARPARQTEPDPVPPSGCSDAGGVGRHTAGAVRDRRR